jgi:hypothetical protein
MLYGLKRIEARINPHKETEEATTETSAPQ